VRKLSADRLGSLLSQAKPAVAERVLVLGLFAVAMGYLEAAVVVYLRQIYYPAGFAFPLSGTMLGPTLLVESGREAATLIMLASIAWLSGRSRLERFSWFLFVFGVWDICYYLGLKALLGWPPSLVTWDILFLIPIPWVAPVLAPVLVAALMIVLGLAYLNLGRTGRGVRGNPVDWLAIAVGATAILLSFLSDYGLLVARRADFAAHVPASYPWWLLVSGLAAVVWAAFFRIYKRSPASGPTS
jgi:hypothetical protein